MAESDTDDGLVDDGSRNGMLGVDEQDAQDDYAEYHKSFAESPGNSQASQISEEPQYANNGQTSTPLFSPSHSQSQSQALQSQALLQTPASRGFVAPKPTCDSNESEVS